ncbi:transglutaminaseTgpA domain-containing protein [Rhodoferax sp.]|uniref:transglutaminaseTgpA domain-containing protein n=1 Tax=Rhodoferax sp. TaxID=50421 RepID=UPI002ACDE200|nr:transglutaminaseTgpA domain-containing protein [Rhodoferax sp.]MDZ7919680.1 transglutaminaseTgpA domain-containing protein [Rhodoferax sp.]
MAVSAPTLPAAADDSPPLQSRGVLILTGLSYAFVGLSFSYLDRRYGHFGLEGTLWVMWALFGFGAGALHALKPRGTGGQIQWVIMGSVGGLLAVFPGFLMFNMLRWVCLLMMVVMGARAAVMRTKRDFYFTLIVIFSVSFMAGTHGNADWTLWIYLGPAWAFGALALAWEHAAGNPVSRWIKLWMTGGFLSTALLLTALLFLFMPRPSTLGFGFLPPGTDTPGIFTTPAGGGNQDGGQGGGNGAGGNDSAGAPDASGQPQPGGTLERWQGMLKEMRSSLKDASIPQWQRNALGAVLGASEWVLSALGDEPGRGAKGPKNSDTDPTIQVQKFKLTAQQLFDWLMALLLALVLCLLGYWLWRRRYRVGMVITLSMARLLARRYPLRSMQLSAWSLKWCLRTHGHHMLAGQSIREYVISASEMPPLAKKWLRHAMEDYCAVRFGGAPATYVRANRMRESVWGAYEVSSGLMPELSK